MKRREFIKRAAALSLVIFSGARFALRPVGKNIIRPPGSMTEDDFNYQCVRCGKCILTCPAKCLKPVPIGKGLAEWGSPEIIPREAGCIRCMNCSVICPSSAIARVDENSVKMGTAGIDTGTCLVWQSGKDCLVCMEYCPVGAIYTDSKGRPVVNETLCVGCGLCEQNCPVNGVAAIRVSSRGEKRYHLREKVYR